MTTKIYRINKENNFVTKEKELNYDFEVFKNNPKKYYKDWKIESDPETYYHIASHVDYKFPKFANDILREKTREERILEDNETSLLEAGEYVENNEIIKVGAPRDLKIYYWDKNTNSWLVDTDTMSSNELNSWKNSEKAKQDKLVLEEILNKPNLMDETIIKINQEIDKLNQIIKD